MSGDLLRIGSVYKLNLRLHETHAGRLLAGSVAEGKSPEDLDSHASAAVQELFATLR